MLKINNNCVKCVSGNVPGLTLENGIALFDRDFNGEYYEGSKKNAAGVWESDGCRYFPQYENSDNDINLIGFERM